MQQMGINIVPTDSIELHRGEGDLTHSDNKSRSDTCITHLGVTYSITQFAHQSETPLETCPYCAGTGQLYTRKCRNCNGRGLKVMIKPETGRKAGR